MRLAIRLAAAVTAVAAAAALAACSPSASPGAESTQSTLDRVIQSKVLRVGLVADYPPYESKTASGDFEGYEADIARMLADSLDAKVEFVETTVENRVPSAQTGKVDVMFGSMAMTPARAQVVAFTDPYVSNARVIVVRNDSNFKSKADLDGARVGVQKGSLYDDILQQYWPEVEIAYFDSATDYETALKNGQVDAFIADSNIATLQAAEDPVFRVIKTDELGPREFIGMGIPQGDQRWLNYLNYFIFNMEVEGTNDAAFKTWFKGEPPYSARLD